MQTIDEKAIFSLLDLEDEEICITNIYEEDSHKYICVETKPTAHYCPICSYRMYSKGVKTRTVNHPILQDT